MRWKKDLFHGAKKKLLDVCLRPKLELCFMKRYEVTSNQIMKVDIFDETLICLSSRRHINVGPKNDHSPYREYVLILIESIREFVHVVDRKFGLPVSACPASRRLWFIKMVAVKFDSFQKSLSKTIFKKYFSAPHESW